MMGFTSFNPSTPSVRASLKTWMAGTSPAMTVAALPLGFERPRQERLDRRVYGQCAIQQRRDGGRDRHVDGPLARHGKQHRSGEHPFGQSAVNVVRLPPAPEFNAETEIARLRARTGQQQIAQTGKS